MLTYAITGVAGYVAPRHLRAIKDTGGLVVAACDPHDSVGILDSYNMECCFHKESKAFCRECMYVQPDYFVICSPNHVHYEQCLVGLRNAADVICEKPVVLTYHDICRLKDCEAETGKKVYTILQSRLKPELIELKNKLGSWHSVQLRYHTPRGPWYGTTWKADTRKSGGLATNIGVHMFDLLLWFFGEEFADLKLSVKRKDRVTGRFVAPKADIMFDLSIEPHNGVLREIIIDDEKVDFTDSFTDLHTVSYAKVLAGEGFTLDDAAPSVKICEKIRRI